MDPIAIPASLYLFSRTCLFLTAKHATMISVFTSASKSASSARESNSPQEKPRWTVVSVTLDISGISSQLSANATGPLGSILASMVPASAAQRFLTQSFRPMQQAACAS